MKKVVSILLGLFLGLFLADGVVSLLDDTLILGFGLYAITLLRGMLFVFSFGLAVVIYGLMAITPSIPKRFFLPLVLFSPLAMLAMVPVSIYHFAHVQQAAWLMSLLQVLVGLGVLLWMQGGLKCRWPLLPEERLGEPGFSWPNLFGFLVANFLVLIPGTLIYLLFCLALAIDQFSGGFLALRWDHLAVRTRHYRRADGKAVQLIPMIHIGESAFYRQMAASVPTNSIILLEGVTDEHDLLDHKISYERLATSLGLSEQQQSFDPAPTQGRHADIDVQKFTPSTIEFLNLAIRFHRTGFTLPLLREWMGKSQDPALINQLWADLLTLRNQHLLDEIQTELRTAGSVVVPWGAAHMPGLAREIQKLGFELSRSQEYTAIRFRTVWSTVAGGLGRSGAKSSN